MSLVRVDPELLRPIEDPTQLVEYMRDSETPVEDFRVGTEHEKIALYEADLAPVPYEGERGIHALLSALRDEHGFEPLLDDDRLVGLERDGASITLEPGGQLELSGAPLHSLHETCSEFNEHVALMKQISARFGIIWLGLGIHPLAEIDELPRMPRQRYTVMREYIGARDELGLEMMHGTGTVQANYDFASEADMARKLRVALAASPVVTALYANSSVSEGVPNGFESRRAWVWRHTDPDRCGFLPFVFDDGWGEGTAYSRYAEWAQDVPLLFLVRDERHLPAHGLTFRDFLANGFEGEPATMADWHVHLTTLFPEARVKRVIEVRGADAVPPKLVCGLPAFWKGLFYDEDALAGAEALTGPWSHAQVDALHAEVTRAGLKADTPDGPILAVAKELVDLSAQALKRMDNRNRAGHDESIFLDPLYEIIDRGTSPARYLLECWDGAWSRRIEFLIDYARY